MGEFAEQPEPRATAPDRIPGPMSPRALAAFFAVGLIGLVLFLAYYHQAFPEASLDIRMTRQEALDAAVKYIADRGFDVEGLRPTAIMNKRGNEVNYLERHLGLAEANELFARAVPVWRWEVRLFRELDELEYGVDFSPDGRAVEFIRDLPEKDEGARLDREQARQIAADFLRDNSGLDATQYEFIEYRGFDRPHRYDHEFVWKRQDFDVGGAQLRASVTVQGDRVGAFEQWLKIPEAWTKSQDELARRRSLLSRVDGIFDFLLFVAIFGVLFWRLYQRDGRFKPALLLGLATFVLILAAEVNAVPLTFHFYDTTQTFSSYWIGRFQHAVTDALFEASAIALVFLVADAMARYRLADRPWAAGVFHRRFLGSTNAFRQVLAGYAMMFVGIGYVTIFYVAGQKWFGFWVPADLPGMDYVATWLPSFEAFLTGYRASLSEELIYRLFAIAFLYWITGRAWVAIVVPAAIWGFAHTFYPQEPIWVRGAELTIYGVVFGVIFWRFGLVTTLVDHYLFNVLVGIIPLMQSGRASLVAHGVVTLSLPLVGALVARALWRAKAEEKAREPAPNDGKESATSEHESESEAPLGDDASIPPTWIPRPRVVVIGFFAASVVAALATRWLPIPDFFGEPPPVKIGPDEAREKAKTYLIEAGYDAEDVAGWRVDTFYSNAKRAMPPYVVDQLGAWRAAEEYADQYRYAPEWTTRWYRDGDWTHYLVKVGADGALERLSVRLEEEAPGAKLDEAQALAVATDYLAKRGLDLDQWEHAETSQRKRPHRLDYWLTFKHRTERVADAERRLTVEVAGDRIGEYSQSYVKVPQAWSRERDIERKGVRNRSRRVVGTVVKIALVLFLIYQYFRLLRRRLLTRDDWKALAIGAVAVGAVPTLLGLVNDLPTIGRGYFSATETSYGVYLGLRFARWPAGILGEALVMFVVLLIAMLIFKAWNPDSASVPDWRRWLAPLRPRNWGASVNLQGVVLAIGGALTFHAFGETMLWLKAKMLPHAFQPQSASSRLELEQLSEILRFAGDFSEVLGLATVAFIIVATLRRFLPRDGYVAAFIFFIVLFTQELGSLSSAQLAFAVVTNLILGLLVYGVLTRVFAGNLTAHILFWFILLTRASLPDARRYLVHHDFAFQSAAAWQVLAFIAPFVAIGVAYVLRRRRGATGEVV
ncbi:MAG: CPBP family intramembrane metalloprotease [Deltaproteobacteria bacterium]|nr:CPBP family intramembrane metalloprotease [Deltaproteobacteria bacterium]